MLGLGLISCSAVDAAPGKNSSVGLQDSVATSTITDRELIVLAALGPDGYYDDVLD